MSNLYFTVWDSAGEVALGDPIQRGVATIDGAASSAISFGSAGANAGKRRKRVRLLSDSDVFFATGTSPSVTDGTDGTPLGAENPEYFDIESGHKLIAILRT